MNVETLRRRGRTAAALAGLAGAMLLAAGQAASAPVAATDDAAFLHTLAGEWRGDGMLRRGPQAPAESVVCRADAATPSPEALEIRGRCGGEGFTGTFRISARYDAASGYYTALFAGPPSIGSAQLAGLRDGDRLHLNSAPGQPSGLRIAHTDGGQVRILAETLAAPGGESYVSAEIALQRQ